MKCKLCSRSLRRTTKTGLCSNCSTISLGKFIEKYPTKIILSLLIGVFLLISLASARVYETTPDNSTGWASHSDTAYFGMVMRVANEPIEIYNVTLHPSSSATTVYIYTNGSSLTLINSSTVEANKNASFNMRLNANTVYWIVTGSGGGTYSGYQNVSTKTFSIPFRTDVRIRWEGDGYVVGTTPTLLASGWKEIVGLHLNYTQSLIDTYIGECDSTLIYPFINITFKDETTLSRLNASIPTSSFTYWTNNSNINNSFSYTNLTNNKEYVFCGVPRIVTANIIPNVQYKKDATYPQRIWTQNGLAYSNTTINKTLYLLSSSDGIYTYYQVIDALGNPLSGVQVIAFRDISGSETIVSQGTTDDSGLISLWLNPDFLHTLSFSRENYGSLNVSVTPSFSATPYTIQLGGTANVTQQPDYTRGISISIKPTDDFILKNATYSFNYTIATNFWLLDSWGVSLYYGNGTLIGTQSSLVDTGGIINLQGNTSNSNSIVMNYYYVVNGTYINKSKFWLTQRPNDYSILNLFTDFTTYIGLDMFGVLGDDDGQFAKALISVLILVVMTGTLSLRYGMQSEATVMGILFGGVLLLNTFNFIPTPDFLEGKGVLLGDVVAFVILIITIGTIFREESR